MSPRRRGLSGALRDLAGAALPLRLRDLNGEIADRLKKIPTPLNDYGFDSYGLHPDVARQALIPCAIVYRYYFRAQTHGIEGVPSGRVLLIANHAGQLPFDGAMLGTAMVLEGEPPRIVRAMGEYWIPRLPWISVAAARTGAMVGTPENCRALLHSGECVAAFPEGVRGMNKLWSERYQLQSFGTGFMRLALESDTPVVPVGIVGSEEQQPGLANLPALARLLGMPAFPLTPTFPWLGPLGLLPLPVRYHIHFGEPLRFSGPADDEDAEIERKVEVVRAAISGLLDEGRRARRGIFFG
ncbi:MAG: lysophospholipid acyltransferase family protein [Myxococcota bacterium]